MIDELNNKRQQLLSVGDDPLAAAMAEAHGAKGRGRSIRMDSDDNGRSLHFDESIDDEDNAGPVLQLAAADTFFKPRRDILAHLSGNSGMFLVPVFRNLYKRQDEFFLVRVLC